MVVVPRMHGYGWALDRGPLAQMWPTLVSALGCTARTMDRTALNVVGLKVQRC